MLQRIVARALPAGAAEAAKPSALEAAKVDCKNVRLFIMVSNPL
jgi:hypothetical protein